MSSPSYPRPASEIPWSGPVIRPLEEEDEAIRRAPAYDRKAATAYIPGMPGLRKAIDAIGDDQELKAFGSALPSDPAMKRLRDEIEALSRGNHKVSLIMADLKTASGVSFRSYIPMCAQSTVKAIYTGALLESRPQALAENGQYMHDAIVYSANIPYERLRKIYGTAPLSAWCREAGVDPGFALPDYPRDKNARDMFKLWTRLYCFLNGDAPGAAFSAYYAASLASAAREKLGIRFPLQTKAGWECGLDESLPYDPNAVIPARFTDGDPANDECAINDTGIIYTDGGPYIFVIYTDHPYGVFRDRASPNPLYGLTEALLEVQQSFPQ